MASWWVVIGLELLVLQLVGLGVSKSRETGWIIFLVPRVGYLEVPGQDPGQVQGQDPEESLPLVQEEGQCLLLAL